MSDTIFKGIGGEMQIAGMTFKCLEYEFKTSERPDFQIQYELDEFRYKLGYPKRLGD